VVNVTVLVKVGAGVDVGRTGVIVEVGINVAVGSGRMASMMFGVTASSAANMVAPALMSVTNMFCDIGFLPPLGAVLRETDLLDIITPINP
jgi:hypothetical protein